MVIHNSGSIIVPKYTNEPDKHFFDEWKKVMNHKDVKIMLEGGIEKDASKLLKELFPNHEPKLYESFVRLQPPAGQAAVHCVTVKCVPVLIVLKVCLLLFDRIVFIFVKLMTFT